MPEADILRYGSDVCFTRRSGHGPQGEASLFESGHQHAPDFQLSAHGALESVKVADVVFRFGPEQPHFEFACRALEERLNDCHLVRADPAPCAFVLRIASLSCCVSVLTPISSDFDSSLVGYAIQWPSTIEMPGRLMKAWLCPLSNIGNILSAVLL